MAKVFSVLCLLNGLTRSGQRGTRIESSNGLGANDACGIGNTYWFQPDS